MSDKWWKPESFWELGAFSILFSFIGIILFSFYNTATSHGRVEFCYIETAGDNIFLLGSIPYREDIVISKQSNLEEAIQAARKIHCKLWSEK